MNTTLNTARFEWGAVAAGTTLALAISIVLLQFGSVIGFTTDTPLRDTEDFTSWGVIATGIWLLWVQLLASLAGGYLAGWFRTTTPEFSDYEAELRDGVAGLITWGLSTVLVFIGVSIAGMFASYIQQITGTEINSEVTNAEQNAALIFAFAAGATSLLSAVAAWWAGTKGGEHRDRKIDFSKELSFRRQ